MRILTRLLTDVPMMNDGALASILTTYQSYLSHSSHLSHSDPMGTGTLPVLMAEHPVLAKLRSEAKPQMTVKDGIATVPIHGVLGYKPDVFELLYGGMEDSRNVLDMVQAAATDTKVRGILLDFDSPGGFFTGGPEVADTIRYANSVKPVVAFTGGTAASMAYWQYSQAGQTVASRSAQVGSVGAYATHLDVSKMLADRGVKLEVIKNKEADFKAIGLPGTALNDTQRDHLQTRIQAGYDEFRGAVQKARPNVTEDSLRGQSFTGAEAKDRGLIDSIGGMDWAYSLLRHEMKSK